MQNYLECQVEYIILNGGYKEVQEGEAEEVRRVESYILKTTGNFVFNFMFLFLFKKFYVYGCFVWMCFCTCLVPTKARKNVGSPGIGLVGICELGIKAGFSRKAAKALRLRAISLDLPPIPYNGKDRCDTDNTLNLNEGSRYSQTLSGKQEIASCPPTNSLCYTHRMECHSVTKKNKQL